MRKRQLVRWVFYGGLGLLLALIVTGALGMLLPRGLATRVAYNSEAYLFALVLGAWIQYALPRVPDGRRMTFALGHGAIWGAIGLWMLMADLPSRIATLNEPAFALAILIPYVSMRRPLSRWILGVVPVLIGLTVWAVIAAPQSWVIDQAETFGLVVLAILTFDLFDRQLLDPDVRVGRWQRWAWYGFLILEPVVVSAVGTEARMVQSGLGLALEYLGRVHESFVGVLLVALILHLDQTYRAKLSAQSRKFEAAAV